MVQKKSKMTKNSNQGGPALKLFRVEFRTLGMTKKVKTEEMIERPARQVEEKFVWKLILNIFQLQFARKLRN